MWIRKQDGTYVNDALLQTMYVSGSEVMATAVYGNVLLGVYDSPAEAKSRLSLVVMGLCSGTMMTF